MSVDLELKKAFQELQGKMIQTAQQLQMADMQIESLKRQKLHAALVKEEVSNLPETTNLYMGIGRMFVAREKVEVMKNLETKDKDQKEKITSIESNKEYLGKNLKESEANLRELVTSKQRK